MSLVYHKTFSICDCTFMCVFVCGIYFCINVVAWLLFENWATKKLRNFISLSIIFIKRVTLRIIALITWAFCRTVIFNANASHTRNQKMYNKSFMFYTFFFFFLFCTHRCTQSEWEKANFDGDFKWLKTFMSSSSLLSDRKCNRKLNGGANFINKE